MNSKKKRTIKVFVDGEVLVIPHFSGIGHYTAALLSAVDKLLSTPEYSHFRFEIGAPKNLKHNLGRFNFENFIVRNMPFSPHTVNGLKKREILPPIDLLYGKRVYLFPNYSTWPTLFSQVIPIIYDLSFIQLPEYVEPRNQEFLVDQVNKSVQRSSKIITISRYIQGEIQNHFNLDKNKIDIVFPATDIENYYRRSEHDIVHTKAKFGVYGKYILFVGNIEPRKNLMTLLCAYEKLPKKIQDEYALLLVGARGWLDSDIHKKIIEMRISGLRVIQPIAYVEDNDIPALYSGASVFIYISKYEGFGIPPLESMACGTPVISSDNTSLPEAVGSAAIKVKATSQTEVNDAILKIISDPILVNKLVEQGYEQVQKYNWIKSAKQLLKSIEDVA